MSSMEVKIAALEAEIAELQAERRAAAAPEDKRLLLEAITAKQRTLNILMTPSGHNSAKQDSFKNKLRRRRTAIPKSLINNSDSCEICGEIVGNTALEGSHIVDHQFDAELEKAYNSDQLLPVSISDAANGLLLCPTCHSHFDKAATIFTKNKTESGRCITISPSGVITLLGEAARVNYKFLQNKKVPWANQIGRKKDYPSSNLLIFANSLKLKVTQGKWLTELMDQAEDEDQDDEPPRQKQRKKAPPPPRKKSRTN